MPDKNPKTVVYTDEKTLNFYIQYYADLQVQAEAEIHNQNRLIRQYGRIIKQIKDEKKFTITIESNIA